MKKDSAIFKAKALDIYNDRHRHLYEPARLALRKQLNDLLQQNLGGNALLRCTVEEGNVKKFESLFKKSLSKKYRAKIKKPADIFQWVGDIVRTRITCNVLTDVMRVCEIIERAGKTSTGKRIPHPSLRPSAQFRLGDFIKEPWPNGYRAVHNYVEIEMPFKGEQVHINCEVQVRTLLQDAWGKLTHDDFYKPETSPPPLLISLGKNLADLMVALDHIAQDIRTELDRSPQDEKTRKRPARTKQRKASSQRADEELKSSSGTEQPTASAHPIYSAGGVVTGEAISVGEQYALFRLPDDRIGILHWSQVRTVAGGYIDVRLHVEVGQIRQLRIEKIDNEKNRIELALINT